MVSLALVLTSRGKTLRLPCDRVRGYGICESREEGKGYGVTAPRVIMLNTQRVRNQLLTVVYSLSI